MFSDVCIVASTSGIRIAIDFRRTFSATGPSAQVFPRTARRLGSQRVDIEDRVEERIPVHVSIPFAATGDLSRSGDAEGWRTKSLIQKPLLSQHRRKDTMLFFVVLFR